MLKRTLTGLVILILLAGGLALRLVSPWFFDAFILILTYACIIEMFMAYKVANRKFFKVPLFLLPVGLMFIFKWTTRPFMWLIAAFLGLFLICMLSELIIYASRRKHENQEVNTKESVSRPLLDLTKTTMTVAVYPTLILSALFGINNFGLNTGFVGLIMTFAVSMFTDVFAYLFGVMFGQKGKSHRLAPEISPKKSVVGFVFGIVGGLIAGGVGYVLFVYLGWFGAFSGVGKGAAIAFFAVLGAVGALLTQMGDLVASAFKREVGLKDFGNIFPGHGGFMDRCDGQMFTAALVYCLMLIVF